MGELEGSRASLAELEAEEVTWVSRPPDEAEKRAYPGTPFGTWHAACSGGCSLPSAAFARFKQLHVGARDGTWGLGT